MSTLRTAALLALPALLAAEEPLRLGHFATVTHLQAVAAHELSARGEGWFERELGRPVAWSVFTAGPTAVEAIFLGTVDAVYLGPNPAINGFLRSGGREVRVIAGASRGGAALVVPGGSAAAGPEDFRGRALATPQLGNTQDVAARAWLAAGGLRIHLAGGDARVVPVRGPDQLNLFRRGDLAGVWTVEPWVSRLETEAGGRVLLEFPDEVTTVFAVRAALAERGGAAPALAAAHAALTRHLADNPARAAELVRAGLERLTRRPVPSALVERCLARVRPDVSLDPAELQRFADAARSAGFLRGSADLRGLVVLPPAP